MDDAEVEQRLIQRVVAGDEAACRAFVVRYEPVVARVAHGMLGVGDEADDVGQEAFIRAFRALPRFKGDSQVSTWLTRITMNLALDALAKRKRRRGWVRLVGGAVDDAVGMERVEQPTNTTDRNTAIRVALAGLDPPHRSVVVYRLLEERSVKETAELLGIPEGTVMSRLKRALAKLEPVLQPWRNDEQ